jgi:serine/threonine protein kinase
LSGSVVLAKDAETNETIAIKRVKHDEQFAIAFSMLFFVSIVASVFRSRELSLMRKLDHPNVVKLLGFFFASAKGSVVPSIKHHRGSAAISTGTKFSDVVGHNLKAVERLMASSSSSMTYSPDEDAENEVSEELQEEEITTAAEDVKADPASPGIYLHLVMPYVPASLSDIIKAYKALQQTLPMPYVQVYFFNLFRGLAYLQSMHILHRDLYVHIWCFVCNRAHFNPRFLRGSKPQNILVNPDTNVLQICDFGNAKFFVDGEENSSYAVSRFEVFSFVSCRD